VNGRVINTQNSENLLTGMGLGLMMEGVSSVFFLKQLDFLLLGLDHMVNTYNILRLRECQASFTLVPIVVDIGYQGGQSSFNSVAELAAVANIPAYTINGMADGGYILDHVLPHPGFRIVAVSQRLFTTEVVEAGGAVVHAGGGATCYGAGADGVIVCLNFALPQGLALRAELEKQGVRAALWQVSRVGQDVVEVIASNMGSPRRCVVIDDGKVTLGAGAMVASGLAARCPGVRCDVLQRQPSESWYYPHAEEFSVDAGMVLRQWRE